MAKSRNGTILLWLAAALLIGLTPREGHADDWEEIRDDLEMKEVAYPSSALFPARITFLRTSLEKLSLGVVRAQDLGKARLPVKTMVEKSKAIAGINANFFDTEGAPLGLIVSRAIVHRKMHWGGKTLTGILQVKRNGPSIVGRDAFSFGGVLEAVQAGPRLLLRGEKTPSLSDNAYSRRAGVCIDKEGRLILFCVSSGLLGITVPQLQEVLLSEGIGCSDALNFDGGGSAQLHLSEQGADYRLSIAGSDDVPVMVALFAHDES